MGVPLSVILASAAVAAAVPTLVWGWPASGTAVGRRARPSRRTSGGCWTSTSCGWRTRSASASSVPWPRDRAAGGAT